MDVFLFHRAKRSKTYQSWNRWGYKQILLVYQDFFQKRLALAFSSTFLLGILSYYFPLLLFFFFLCVLFPKCSWIGFFLGFFYAFSPSLPEKIEGEGIFIPDKITPLKTVTYKGYCITGHIMQSKNTWNRSLPASIFSKTEDLSLLSPFAYTGLAERKSPTYHLKIEDKTTLPIKNKALFRHKWKKTLSTFLKSQMKNSQAAHFLTALVTGYLTDLYLKFSFYKLGLSHILAISGFHFSLLIGIASLFMLWAPLRVKALLLLIVASSYFCLMGHTPSVTRAFIMIFVHYIAKFLDQYSCPINNLGLAMLIVLLIDPLAVFALSFQLSFLSCLGIFLYYPLFSQKIKRGKGISFFLYTYYLEALSLSFSVLLFISPLCLLIFKKISILGLFYNFFFSFASTYMLCSSSCFAHLLWNLSSFRQFLISSFGLYHNVRSYSRIIPSYFFRFLSNHSYELKLSYFFNFYYFSTRNLFIFRI